MALSRIPWFSRRALFAAEGEIQTTPLLQVHLNGLVGVVYVIRHLGCGKEYVGITTRRPELRWLQHVRAAEQGGHCLIHCALREDGLQTFSFEVVWTGAVTALCLREKELIAERGSLMPRGYNMTPGGLPLPLTPQTRSMLRLGVEDILRDELVLKKQLVLKHSTRDRGRDVCLLSLEEATRLLDYNIFPACKAHHHMRRSRAARGNYKFIQTVDGEPTHWVVPHTEMLDWVRWGWTNDFLKGA